MRPRERYALWGPEETGDVELVALLLGTGAGGHSVSEIAIAVLQRFGGLAGLARTEVGELCGVPGEIARVHRPGKRARHAVVVPVQEAADARDRDSQAEAREIPPLPPPSLSRANCPCGHRCLREPSCPLLIPLPSDTLPSLSASSLVVSYTKSIEGAHNLS